MIGDGTPHTPATQPFPPEGTGPAAVSPTIPHPARVWDFWLGGKNNYWPDRVVGAEVARRYPAITGMAHQSRAFRARVVSWLADPAGPARVRQFVDIGLDFPSGQPTHQIAQATAPDTRTVYVEDDPLVMAHARALLVDPPAVTGHVDAGYRDTDRIVAESALLLDFGEPVAVMFMGLLGYEPDDNEARRVIADIMGACPSGSYSVLWCATGTSPGIATAAEILAEAGTHYTLRTPEQLAGWFDGLEMVEPGMVPISEWRPGTSDIGQPAKVDAYGGVARKT